MEQTTAPATHLRLVMIAAWHRDGEAFLYLAILRAFVFTLSYECTVPIFGIGIFAITYYCLNLWLVSVNKTPSTQEKVLNIISLEKIPCTVVGIS